MMMINSSRVGLDCEYAGFEQGPIRPPSEAASLLIRITRNCPWNRCTFCPVYKGREFSLRPVDHVLEDIDRVHRYAMAIRQIGAGQGQTSAAELARVTATDGEQDHAALQAALNWARSGMRSIFFQDANSLIIKPARLLAILNHLHRCFPWVTRITSYARSHTIARISDHDLAAMATAGLSRIHIGMESGSDLVLARVNKGADKKTHIKAGLKVKNAGMELSEYVMPGLGGRELSLEHAKETADALNQINPDYIRLRSLVVVDRVELHRELCQGSFVKLSEVETAQELVLFLKALNGITSSLKSDHILNLFENLAGRFPEAKEGLVAMVQDFLDLPPNEQVIYQVGRRIGLFRGLDDLADPNKKSHAVEACTRLGVTSATVDAVCDQLMKRFI